MGPSHCRDVLPRHLPLAPRFPVHLTRSQLLSPFAATKFTSAGGEVVVRIQPIEGEEDLPARDAFGWPLQWVEFSIRDTGEGMPLDQQHKLFKARRRRRWRLASLAFIIPSTE